MLLTYFVWLFSFYTPRKQENFDLLMFFGGKERPAAWIGLIEFIIEILDKIKNP